MGKKYVIWTMVAIHSLHSVSYRFVLTRCWLLRFLPITSALVLSSSSNVGSLGLLLGVLAPNV